MARGALLGLRALSRRQSRPGSLWHWGLWVTYCVHTMQGATRGTLAERQASACGWSRAEPQRDVRFVKHEGQHSTRELALDSALSARPTTAARPQCSRGGWRSGEEFALPRTTPWAQRRWWRMQAAAKTQ